MGDTSMGSRTKQRERRERLDPHQAGPAPPLFERAYLLCHTPAFVGEGDGMYRSGEDVSRHGASWAPLPIFLLDFVAGPSTSALGYIVRWANYEAD